MDSSIKDNANPVIHSIDRNTRSRIVLEPFQRWNSAQSPEDRAIVKALSDGNAALLKQAGFAIASPLRPSYVPSSVVRKQREHEPDIQRENIDADEIFDIIRNIQDPEHPLTLEQLNVVNRDHVQVEDHWDSDAMSLVDVRFT